MLIPSLRKYYSPEPGFSLSFFNESVSTSPRKYWELIEKMNMRWQPVQHQTAALSFVVTRVLLLMAGEVLQVQALKMANKEKGACEKIFKLFLYVQMMYWPFEVMFVTATDWIHPLHEILGGQWVCDVIFFIKYSAWHIIVFHSFIIAMVRYTFLIHSRFVDSKGKENVKSFFFWIILLVAFVTTFWKYFGSGDLDSDPYVNKCRGKHHLVFLRFKNAMEGVKGFCDKDYDSEDISSYLTAMAKKTSCILSAVIFILMGLNVTEGFLYVKVIRYVQR